MRHQSLLLIIVLLAAGCAALPTAPAPTTTPPVPAATITPPNSDATELTLVELWTPDGLNPAYTVVDEREGSCFAGALKAQRPDAWRCAYEEADASISRLLDPCLENPSEAQSPLACLAADGRSVTLLTLTEPLPREFANLPEHETLPLALTLDNGDVCDLTTGATITVDIAGEAQRVNYFCQSGGVLIGEPDDAEAIWTIHYSADPRGLGEILTLGIAGATVFRGDTANVGWSSGRDASAALQRVLPDRRPGFTRLVFDFGDGGVPDYEIGYVNEPVIDEAGSPVALDGAFKLRVWFLYPAVDSPAYPGERRVAIAPESNVNETVLARDGDGSHFWYVGLDSMSGFVVRRTDDGRRLFLDLYDPEPQLALRPVLGVGSAGEGVRALSDRLIAAGYLAAPPADDAYTEAVRQAVVAFETDGGLIPDGVAGPDVWAALERSQPPPRAGTSARAMTTVKRLAAFNQAGNSVTPAGNIEVFVRSGPGLDFAPVGSLLPGQSAEVIGQQPGSSPTTSWWQVCCLAGQSGWVRADVVNVTGAAEAVATAPPPPPPGADGIRPGARLNQTAEGAPILYFTFDDGPSTGSTEAVAALMAENGGRGTFFAIGRQVDWTPAIAAAVAAGHSVQNHTYNHAALDTLTRPDYFGEVERTQTAILGATGRLPTCLRPPYGATDGTTFQMADELGLDVVLWTVDTQDWRLPGVEAIVSHILSHAAPGAVILMHDGGGDRSQTIEALRIVLPQLRTQGYVFEALCG